MRPTTIHTDKGAFHYICTSFGPTSKIYTGDHNGVPKELIVDHWKSSLNGALLEYTPTTFRYKEYTE